MDRRLATGHMPGRRFHPSPRTRACRPRVDEQHTGTRPTPSGSSAASDRHTAAERAHCSASVTLPSASPLWAAVSASGGQPAARSASTPLQPALDQLVASFTQKPVQMAPQELSDTGEIVGAAGMVDGPLHVAGAARTNRSPSGAAAAQALALIAVAQSGASPGRDRGAETIHGSSRPAAAERWSGRAPRAAVTSPCAPGPRRTTGRTDDQGWSCEAKSAGSPAAMRPAVRRGSTPRSRGRRRATEVGAAGSRWRIHEAVVSSSATGQPSLRRTRVCIGPSSGSSPACASSDTASTADIARSALLNSSSRRWARIRPSGSAGSQREATAS